MKHLKKLLCGLLAAALMLCALPAAALAEGAPAQPTRTERLEITAETPLTDELDTGLEVGAVRQWRHPYAAKLLYSGEL